MPIFADKRYEGEIVRARLETKVKTDGSATSSIKVRVQVPGQGFIDHSLYLTQDSQVRTRKVLSELNDEIWEGALPFVLRDPAKYLVGRPCNITTETHAYKDINGIESVGVRVKWLNGPMQTGKPATEDDVQRLLAMMGIADDPAAVPLENATAEPIADDDTPF